MLYLMQGDRAKALDCVEKMAEYAVAFDTRPEKANYSSILINKVEHTRSGDTSLCSKLLRGRFSSRIWAPIKNEAKFAAAIQLMEKHI